LNLKTLVIKKSKYIFVFSIFCVLLPLFSPIESFANEGSLRSVYNDEEISILDTLIGERVLQNNSIDEFSWIYSNKSISGQENLEFTLNEEAFVHIFFNDYNLPPESIILSSQDSSHLLALSGQNEFLIEMGPGSYKINVEGLVEGNSINLLKKQSPFIWGYGILGPRQSNYLSYIDYKDGIEAGNTLLTYGNQEIIEEHNIPLSRIDESDVFNISLNTQFTGHGSVQTFDEDLENEFVGYTEAHIDEKIDKYLVGLKTYGKGKIVFISEDFITLNSSHLKNLLTNESLLYEEIVTVESDSEIELKLQSLVPILFLILLALTVFLISINTQSFSEIYKKISSKQVQEKSFTRVEAIVNSYIKYHVILLISFIVIIVGVQFIPLVGSLGVLVSFYNEYSDFINIVVIAICILLILSTIVILLIHYLRRIVGLLRNRIKIELPPKLVFKLAYLSGVFLLSILTILVAFKSGLVALIPLGLIFIIVWVVDISKSPRVRLIALITSSTLSLLLILIATFSLLDNYVDLTEKRIEKSVSISDQNDGSRLLTEKTPIDLELEINENLESYILSTDLLETINLDQNVYIGIKGYKQALNKFLLYSPSFDEYMYSTTTSDGYMILSKTDLKIDNTSLDSFLNSKSARGKKIEIDREALMHNWQDEDENKITWESLFDRSVDTSQKTNTLFTFEAEADREIIVEADSTIEFEINVEDIGEIMGYEEFFVYLLDLDGKIIDSEILSLEKSIYGKSSSASYPVDLEPNANGIYQILILRTPLSQSIVETLTPTYLLTDSRIKSISIENRTSKIRDIRVYNIGSIDNSEERETSYAFTKSSSPKLINNIMLCSKMNCDIFIYKIGNGVDVSAFENIDISLYTIGENEIILPESVNFYLSK
jgi:hypothetical protein